MKLPRPAMSDTAPPTLVQTTIDVVLSGALLYLLLYPVGYQSVQIPVLFVLGLVSGLRVVYSNRKISTTLASAVALLMLAGAMAAIIGSNNDGVAYGVRIWVAGPLIFGAWAASANRSFLRLTCWAILAGTSVVSIIILLYVGGNMGIVPQLVPDLVGNSMGMGFDGSDGRTAIRMFGLSTLAAGTPICIASAFLGRDPLLPSVWLRRFAGLVSLTAALVAGRDAVVLVSFVAPLLVLAWRRWIPSKNKRRLRPKVVLMLFALGIAAPFLVPVVLELPGVRKALASTEAFFMGTQIAGISETARSEQSAQLLAAWANRPFFGHGLGATIPGFSRNAERPWEFELQYHMYLFQFGLVGVTLILLALALAAAGLVRVVRDTPELVGVATLALAGAVGMLVANATNPYLQAPGHLWALFFPMMVINVGLSQSTHRDRVDSVHAIRV